MPEVKLAPRAVWRGRRTPQQTNDNAADQVTGEPTMTRAQVLQQLADSKAELVDRFGVTGIALFGSVARDSAGADSDVDILASFDGPATSALYFGVHFFIEDLLGRPIDLVTDKALRPALRP
jgi:predicted nucleotidyltransferase